MTTKGPLCLLSLLPLFAPFSMGVECPLFHLGCERDMRVYLNLSIASLFRAGLVVGQRRLRRKKKEREREKGGLEGMWI